MHRVYLRAALLLFLPVVVFWPALNGSFIWDDVTFISDNPLMHQPDALFRIWFTRESTDYWPVSYSIFYFFWHAFGNSTVWLHVLNLLVHIANGFLLWNILERLKFQRAFAVALIFAVHPMTVEAVAWVFQLKTTLAAFFAFLSLYLYLGQRNFSAVGSFAVALLTKTSVVAWPLIVLGSRWRKSEWRKLIPFFVLSLLCGVCGLLWYRYAQLAGGETVRPESLLEKLILASWAYGFYWLKALWPFPLLFVYPRWRVDVANPIAYLPLLAIAGIYAALLWRKARGLLSAQLYYLFAILPVLGIVDIYYMRYSFVADHWAYLALPSCICTFVQIAAPRTQRFGPPLLAAVVLLLSILSFRQSAIYISEESVWRDTLAKNPHAWLAESNLASLLIHQGRNEDAVPHLLRVVEERPDYADGYTSLGIYYFESNQPELARANFLTALRIFPNNARALNSLAAIALAQHQDAAAEEYLKKAIAYRPDYGSAYRNLAVIYRNHGQEAAAREKLLEALALDPADAEVLKMLSPSKTALPK